MPIAYWSHILTHFYLLKGEEPPVCIPGNEVLSVEHIYFINCVDLQVYRNCFFKLLLLFRECSLDKIVEFLKSTNLLSKM